MGNQDSEPVDEAAEESLRLPSLGFRRRRTGPGGSPDQDRAVDGDGAVDEADAAPPAPATPPEEGAGDTEVTAEQPVVETGPEPEPEPEAGPEPEPEPEPGPGAPRPGRESVARRISDAVRAPAREDAGAEPTRVQEPVTPGGGWAARTGASDDAGTTTKRRGRSGKPARTGPRPAVSLPSVSVGGMSGRVAAGTTGVLAGLLMVGGTELALGGCELVRGTSTCGGGPGVVLSLVLVAALVLAGAAGLRITGVPHAGAISFLGVGLVVLVVLLFLLPVVLAPVMLVVIPVLTGAAFLLAHAISASFGDDGGGSDWR